MGHATNVRLITVAVKSLLLVATVGILLPVGCQERVRSDDELVAVFVTNEKWFDAIASAYVSGKVICPDKSFPDDCVLSDAKGAVKRVIEDSHVQAIYVKRNRGRDDGIWMPVQTYGVLSINSSARGYAYLDNPPSSYVKDTLEVDQNGSYYVPLKGKWFIFITK
jgi:hypothetical protein